MIGAGLVGAKEKRPSKEEMKSGMSCGVGVALLGQFERKSYQFRRLSDVANFWL